MNREDLKKSIDIIEPDPYLGARLKAKMAAQKAPAKSYRKLATGVVTIALIFAFVFGFNLTTATPDNPVISNSEQTEQNVKTISPFIMVAGAVDNENSDTDVEYKTLSLNETYPFAYKISFIDVRGMSESERKKAVLDSHEMLMQYVENTKGDNFNYGIGVVRSFNNIIFIENFSNSIKLDLNNMENVKSINAKTSSEWGYIEYYDSTLFISESRNGNENPVPHGTDITIEAEQYYQESGGFHWKNSDKMGNAIDENPDIPLSSFKDTLTFTVEYNDGSKEIGVIDVTFDDEGNATFTSSNYSYVE